MNLFNKRLYSTIGYALVSWRGSVAGLDPLFLQLTACVSGPLGQSISQFNLQIEDSFRVEVAGIRELMNFQKFGSCSMSIFI